MADTESDLLAQEQSILKRMQTGVVGTSFGDIQVRYDVSNLPAALADVRNRLSALRAASGAPPLVTSRVSFTRIAMRRS